MNEKIIDTVEVERVTQHPLEQLFGIPSGTTVVTKNEAIPAELVDHADYDDKDAEIEAQLEQVYTVALNEYQNIADDAAQVEGRFRARHMEVAASFLNTALAAVRDKAKQKQEKDKLRSARPSNTPQTVNNNLGVVVADRNEIMQMIRSKRGDGE